MVSNPLESPRCSFCSADEPILTHKALSHPFRRDHGPFDFYQCRVCGSGLTIPVPSSAALKRLYGSYDSGLPSLHREIMSEDPQAAWYSKIVANLSRQLGSRRSDAFTWVDVGAGSGELARLMAKAFPKGKGTCLDLHPRPTVMESEPSIDWLACDLNQDDFVTPLGLRADVVVSSAVWEHVQKPERFVGNLIRLLNSPGLLYLVCPNYGSWARRLMGTRWPYFTPGEHLFMPTPLGAKLCVTSQWDVIKAPAEEGRVFSGPILLPYSFRYVLRRFGQDFLGKLFPPGLGISLPVGALETTFLRGRWL